MTRAPYTAPPVPDPPVLHEGDTIFCLSSDHRAITLVRVIQPATPTLFGSQVLVEGFYDASRRWYVSHAACDTNMASLYYRLRSLSPKPTEP